MDVYSLVLLISMCSAGAALVATVLARLAAPGVRAVRLRTAARAGGVLALVTLAFSIVVHVFTGHRPGSDEAMGPVRFVAEHPAMIVVAVVAAGVLWLVRASAGK